MKFSWLKLLGINLMKFSLVNEESSQIVEELTAKVEVNNVQTDLAVDFLTADKFAGLWKMEFLMVGCV